MKTTFAPVPEKVAFSLGGYTCYKPTEWDRYLRSTIRKEFPLFALRRALSSRAKAAWKNNDCIQESLKKYLLQQFGILLPSETIFQVYNQSGEGILPRNIIQAISAVIEPLGLEIDQVLVPNKALRIAMSCPEKVVGLEQVARFHGKAGVCMINIEGGYSHAFYWQKMNAQKFASKQFRMAVLLRRKDGCQPTFSAVQGLKDFRRIVIETLSKKAEAASARSLVSEVDSLLQFVDTSSQSDCEEFRAAFDQKMEGFLKKLSSEIRAEARQVLSVGEMIRSIFKEVSVIA